MSDHHHAYLIPLGPCDHLAEHHRYGFAFGCACGTAAEHRWIGPRLPVVADREQAPSIWLAILTEEVGELATAILHNRFGKDSGEKRHNDDMRQEAIQVAAVAVAFIEYLDRHAK